MTALSCEAPIRAFERYVDTTLMRDLWRERLPALLGTSIDVTGCRVLYARCRTYSKPASWRKSFLCVCYQLAVNADASLRSPRLYGKAYLDGRSRLEFNKIEATARLDAKTCRARLVPELDMIVWNFPDDPRLPQLRELVDGDRVIRYLPYESLPFPGPEAIRDIKIDVVRYRPEQRCILRYDIGFGCDGGRLVLFAKVFSDDTGEHVLARMQHCHAAASALGVHVARPLGYCPAVRSVWQEELSGTPLTKTLDAGACRRPLTAIGRCLANLHAAGLPMTQTVSREARLADARKKAHKLGQAFPGLAGALARLIKRAQSELAGLPPVHETVIHGDMHFDQSRLANDGALALFDFDEWSRGDPAQDLADLIVDTHIGGFGRNETEVNCTRLPDMIRVLLDSYRERVTWTVGDAAIGWHARLQLITKAYRTSIQQEPCWQERAPELVALAARLVEPGARTGHD
jgi:aminoglycoside phosphotransferase (APT) family kinase protein